MQKHATHHCDSAGCDATHKRVRLLEAVVNNFPGGILLSDENLDVVFCNDYQKRLLDYPPALFASGAPSLEQLFRFNAERGEYGEGDVERLVQTRLALARQQTAHAFERTRPNGTVLEVRGVPLPGGGFVTTYTDITERRREQELVEHQAQHDHLTQLPNRLLLCDRTEQVLARVKRGARAAVLYLDLDGFKPVNDRLGHAVGDLVLQAVAERLRRLVRGTDTVARIGGDEFVIVQSDVQLPTDCTILAQRIIDTIATPFCFGSQRVNIGTSIGIAFAPCDGVTVDELLRNADEALYRCKAEGRGTFTFFDRDGARTGPALQTVGSLDNVA